MSVGIHPFVLIAAIGVLFAVGALIIAYIVRSGGLRALMIFLAMIFLLPGAFVLVAFYPELVDDRFRTYKRFYSAIEIGMTREQVLAAMERYYPADGKRMQPKIMSDTPTDLGFFMNPESSREPNCEGIFLKLETG